MKKAEAISIIRTEIENLSTPLNQEVSPGVFLPERCDLPAVKREVIGYEKMINEIKSVPDVDGFEVRRGRFMGLEVKMPDGITLV